MPRSTYGDPGAWLPWPVVEAIVKLDLKPSRYRVFLAIACTSARYGGRDAKLGIDDIAEMTGLSERTVKTAVADLVTKGLVTRPSRSRRLAVPMLGSFGPGDPEALFTRHQEAAMGRTFRLASKLLRSDPLDLALSPEWSSRLGLIGPMSYRQARGLVTRDLATVYVGAVLSLHSDERIQGKDL